MFSLSHPHFSLLIFGLVGVSFGFGFEWSAIERAKKGLGETGGQGKAKGGVEGAQVISGGVSQRQVEAVVGEK